MDALSKLREACVKKTFKSFKDAQPGEYIVTQFSKADTGHGERVKIQIENYFMYLPKRFNETLTQGVMDELNKSPKIMVYGGKDPNIQNRLILDFKDTAYFTDVLNADFFTQME